MPPRMSGSGAGRIRSRLYQAQKRLPSLPIYSSDEFPQEWGPEEAPKR
jgi:hypothetical protein